MMLKFKGGPYTKEVGEHNARAIHQRRILLGGKDWARAMARESANGMYHYMKAASIVHGSPMYEYYLAYAQEMQRLSGERAAISCPICGEKMNVQQGCQKCGYQVDPRQKDYPPDWKEVEKLQKKLKISFIEAYLRLSQPEIYPNPEAT